MNEHALHPLVESALEGDALADAPKRAPGRPPGLGCTFESKLGSDASTAYRQRLLDQGLAERDLLHLDEAAPPQVEIKREKIVHRAMVMMHAQGKSRNEIATAFDYAPAQVGVILRQPWARALLIQTLTECGKDLVTEVLAANALDSVQVLLDIQSNVAEKGSVRVAAANSLLDRHLGKPTQRVELARGLPSTEQVDDIDAELSRLRAQQAALEHEPKASKPLAASDASGFALVANSDY